MVEGVEQADRIGIAQAGGAALLRDLGDSAQGLDAGARGVLAADAYPQTERMRKADKHRQPLQQHRQRLAQFVLPQLI
ncbi:Uncharacterised protein [Klebsiella michiganensis]|uniref:Uncharacterized protein n=1 Tax=Klebsiella michiganensis TaxID=1134687 RepID=A0A7H4PJA9_9ENTR|nr:Uncharacterised protein [Klebsiella michiganensis]